jgi:hypothetical protein
MTSIIKVDNLQNQCGANIISESSNVITIGASGDTVTLAAGASQSGFGRSGSVNWDTTPKTSSPVTAVSGNGYFINTTSGAITVNLPAGTAGAIVAISDYANTAATNNITIDPNGTDKINGVNQDAKITTNGAAITLVYVDATRGWKDVNDATLDLTGIPPFVAATGGTITTCGDFKIHTFTGPGTFTVTTAGTPAGSNSVEYLVVAGGGGGSTNRAGAFDGGAGGGGAGGFRQNYPSPTTAGLPVTAQGYPITVGSGGAGGIQGGPPAPGTPGTPGNNSIFSTITSTGGGGGGATEDYTPSLDGLSGGSGGGGGSSDGPPAFGVGGAGNTPPTSPPQGSNGGSSGASNTYAGGGGGGAGGVGAAASGSSANGGAGGVGSASSISGSPVSYSGGGGGGGNTSGGTGGTGGGGAGGASSPAPGAGTSGTVNTGGGGGGVGRNAAPGNNGAAGGSGIVVIRYKFQ